MAHLFRGYPGPGFHDLVFLVVFLLAFNPNDVLSSAAGRGREFIFTFPTNFHSTIRADDGTHLSLSITAVESGQTNISVTVVNLGWNRELTIPARRHGITVELPSEAEAAGSGVQNTTVLVTASKDVTVFALSDEEESAGGFLVRSTRSLGMEYFVVSYTPIVGEWSEFTISATEDDTQIHIQLEAPVLFDNAPYGREELRLTMARLQTVQFQSHSDLTGSRIRANQPISVISGSSASNIPAEFGLADHVVEHLPPVGAWGNEHVLAPFLGRSSGYRCVVVAGCPGTMVRGFGERVLFMAAGQSHEWDAPADTLAVVTSSKPVLVAQFSKGLEADGSQVRIHPDEGIGDPAMLIISPTDLSVGGGVALMSNPALPVGGYCHISVIIRCSETAGLTLNGSPLVPEREYEYTELDNLCAVQKRLEPANSNPVIYVGHNSSDVPFEVSVLVHGTGLRRAYAVSANLGAEVSPCEAIRAGGCCNTVDESRSYDEESSWSSSSLDVTAYSEISNSVPVLVEALRAADGGTATQMLPSLDRTTAPNTEPTSENPRPTTMDSYMVTTSETTSRYVATTESMSQDFAGTLASTPGESNSVSELDATARAASASNEPSNQPFLSSVSPSSYGTHETSARPTAGPTEDLVPRTSRSHETNATEDETATSTDRLDEATHAVQSTSRVHSTLLASTNFSTRVPNVTTPTQPSTSHTVSSWLDSTLMSTSGQRTTELNVETTCSSCQTPFQILLYGVVAMAALVILIVVVFLVKIIQSRRRNARTLPRQKNNLWVAYPANLSADELNLQKMNLKHTTEKEKSEIAGTNGVKTELDSAETVAVTPGSET